MIQECFQVSEENIQGSREFIGVRRIYRAQERRLKGSVEFTGHMRVYRV